MKIKLFGKINKVDDQEDGTVIVEGIASTECVDRQGEVVKADAMKAALPDYLSTGKGPLREMHQPSAAGYVFKADINDKGETIITAKVVDPVAVLKVKEGVYQGFSIGGKAIGKADGVISRLVLSEISLVDRPANPEAMISMWKGDEIEGEDEPVIDESVVKADEPAAASATVEKGMGEVAFAARILEQLEYLRQACEWEAQVEGDESPVPSKLKDAVAALGDILNTMTAEEVAEIKANAEPDADESGDADAAIVELADKPEDVAKAGARNSTADMERIQKAHDSLVELGAVCKCDSIKDVSEKADAAEDLAKANGIAKEEALAKVASLESDLAKLADEKKALEGELAKRDETLVIRDAELVAKDARIKQLEAMPAATKGVLRAVEKTDDSVGVVKAQDAVPVLSSDPLELIKALHSGILR